MLTFSRVTGKVTSDAPNYYEVGHMQPSAFSVGERASIADLACRAVLSLGIADSAAHVEIKVTPDGPKMIELGARMGGDCITTYLVDNSLEGIDMAEAMIRIALGEKIDSWDYGCSGDCVAVLFKPSEKGTVVSIGGLEAARSVPGIIHVELMGVEGRRYESATDDSSRFAFVIAKGPSGEDALARCKAALDKLEVELL